MRRGAHLVAALTLAGCSYDAEGRCRFDDGHNLLLLPIGAAVYGICRATESDKQERSEIRARNHPSRSSDSARASKAG